MTRAAPMDPPRIGVRIAGTGRAVPSGQLTNVDLARLMQTSDEWIVQRTGIHTRRVCDRSKGESCLPLAKEALTKALADARMDARELDMIILATLTEEMPCPPTSCQLAAAVGAGPCGAYDLSGACSGFVFSLNTAWSMVRAGLHRTVAVVGADTLSSYMEYNDHGRATAILFGDAAAATIIRATDDTSKGIIAQAMHTNGARWADLYIPLTMKHFPAEDPPEQAMIGRLHMNGKSVFKFAVSTFPEVIEQTLGRAGLRAEEVDHYICHQSNARILEAARERFGLPAEKLYVNIDKYGNTVAASVPLCLDELREAGRVREGQRVMFVSFGAGLTWGTSLWQL